MFMILFRIITLKKIEKVIILNSIMSIRLCIIYFYLNANDASFSDSYCPCRLTLTVPFFSGLSGSGTYSMVMP